MTSGSTNPLRGANLGLFIDISASTDRTDQGQSKTRIESVKEQIQVLARKMMEIDKDGIDVGTFGQSARMVATNATPDAVDKVFEHVAFEGFTNTHLVVDLIAKRQKDLGTNYIGMIATDGAPTDEAALIKSIVTASHGITKDEELTIVFVQFGADSGAAASLDKLDNGLTGPPHNAKFDIVACYTTDKVIKGDLFETLIHAVNN